MTANVYTDFARPVHALLGLPFDAVTLDQAVARLQWAMQRREPCLWVTPNVNFVAAADADTSFRTAILKAHLSTVDGMPLVWLAKWMGVPLPERVSGSDVFDRLCHPDAKGLPARVFLFGGDDGVAEVAHRALNNSDSNVRSVGYLSPGRGSVSDLSRPADLASIRAANADFLLVSLGAVKGHLWIDANWSHTHTPVVSHLGAVINFLAGSVKRAPAWMQRAGLEWSWRIYQEHSLWRRYFNDGRKLFSVLRKSIFSYRKMSHHWLPKASSHPPLVDVKVANGQACWTLKGVFTVDGLDGLRNACEALNTEPTDITVDCAELHWMDSAAMGLVLLLHAHQIQNHRALVWRGPDVAAIFAAHGCSHLCEQALQAAPTC